MVRVREFLHYNKIRTHYEHREGERFSGNPKTGELLYIIVTCKQCPNMYGATYSKMLPDRSLTLTGDLREGERFSGNTKTGELLCNIVSIVTVSKCIIYTVQLQWRI